MPEAGVLADLLVRPVDSGRGIRYLQTGDRSDSVSYPVLLERARSLLGLLQEKGMRQGDALILFVRDNRAFIDAFWACQLGGFVAVPLAAGTQIAALAKLERVAGLLPSAWLFSDRDLYQRFWQYSGNPGFFAERACLLEEVTLRQRQAVLVRCDADQLAMIQFSSGSTGDPRGVQLTHANLLANIRAIVTAAGISADDATLSWMPLSHDMGLIGFHLVPLFMGIDQVLLDTERFVRRPAHWLETAQTEGSTLLCSPNFGYQHYLKAVANPQLDLHRIRLIFNGAEPVSAAVARTFLERLAPCGLAASSMFPVYGLAEASLAVTFPQPGSGLVTTRVNSRSLQIGAPVETVAEPDGGLELACLGWPVQGCEMRLVDAGGAPLEHGHVGQVQIRGANVTRGYYGCPQCDREVFDHGWLNTGDSGFMSDAGLVITGRLKEVIFAGGQNWFPQDIEQALQAAAGIDAGKLAVGALRSEDNAEDSLLVFVQHRGDLQIFADRLPMLHAALTAATGLHAHAIVPVHNLPRTSSGKIQRYRLCESFADGHYAARLDSLAGLAATAGVTQAGGVAEQQLLDVCRRLFPEIPITVEQNLFELGADSLMLVRVHEEIDALFPGKVVVTDLFEYPTIAELARHIED